MRVGGLAAHFLGAVTCGVHEHDVAAVARRLLDRLRRNARRVLLIPCSKIERVYYFGESVYLTSPEFGPLTCSQALSRATCHVRCTWLLEWHTKT